MITAPIRWAILMKPLRVQLTEQSSTSNLEPGTSTAAAIANAAEDGSLGILICSGSVSSSVG